MMRGCDQKDSIVRRGDTYGAEGAVVGAAEVMVVVTTVEGGA